jgi:hypothetical protein
VGLPQNYVLCPFNIIVPYYIFELTEKSSAEGLPICSKGLLLKACFHKCKTIAGGIMRFSAVLLAIVAALSLAACSSVKETTNYRLVPVTRGMLVNTDVRIVAEDGSFTLVGGQEFDSPFQSDIWRGKSTAFDDANVLQSAAAGRARGGRNVLVYVAGHDKPLYGVLALSRVFASAYGPGSRSYMVSIPNDKILAAYSGSTAVAYENVDWKATFSNGTMQVFHWRGWVLWLSATPL